MPTMKCAACGAKQKRNTIRCEQCGQPLVFKDTFDELSERALESMKLTQKIREMLAGKPPEVTGAVLADLLAMWLAGHVGPSEDEPVEGYREVVLMAHLEAVRALIPVNYKLYVEPQLKKRTH
jgi:uncharacterized membrane protein YvbJ